MSDDSLVPNKSILRKRLLSRRASLSAAARKQISARIVRHVLHTGLALRMRRVGLFIPHGAEINPVPLINRLLTLGKQVYLPVLPKGQDAKRMWFNRIERDSRWVINRFGIPEIESGHTVRAHALDVLFMPLVGYDPAGHRLGMGGGFYDASLAHLHYRRSWRRPKLIGVAFACQRLNERLPHDAWDIPLDAVLTEQGIEIFPGY